MTVNYPGEVLLVHFERFLGPMSHRWSGKGRPENAFEVLEFSGRPQLDSQCLVTFGLSAHHLQIAREGNSTIRMELAIFAYRTFDSKVLGALLFAVGLDAIERHLTSGLHGVLNGSGPVLSGGNPEFEHLYLASPGYFPRSFDWCTELSPPVAIVQLIPISSGERKLITEVGWSAFEDAIAERNIDLLKFDARSAVV